MRLSAFRLAACSGRSAVALSRRAEPKHTEAIVGLNAKMWHKPERVTVLLAGPFETGCFKMSLQGRTCGVSWKEYGHSQPAPQTEAYSSDSRPSAFATQRRSFESSTIDGIRFSCR